LTVPSFGSETGNVLYLIVCAAPPARDTPELVKLLLDDDWDVCVIATPSALDWISVDELESVTGHPVRSRFRRPDEAEFVPRGDAVLVSPVTFNTINKWANGINDTLGLGLLNEALGRQVFVAARPWVNPSLGSHPAFESNCEVLRVAGVLMVNPEDGLDSISHALSNVRRSFNRDQR
jgi:phosphopantothenoylcysteine decarboxylase